MKKDKQRIGEIISNNEGCKFKIIDYINANNITVQFLDEYGAKIYKVQYATAKKGEVKNPYFPSVYGVGCLGLMSDGSKPITKEKGEKENTREYRLWSNMIRRCYDEKFQENNQAYKDAIVCDRWLVFVNFLEDITSIEGYELWKNNPKQRIALDKDIKGKGSKIYCLENCCFISQIENTNESNMRNDTKEKIYGINKNTGEKTQMFNSITEASKKMNLHRQGISKCINGKLKSSGDYYWFKIEKDNN